MEDAWEIIEEIRYAKFGIGSDSQNSLALDLHEATRQLAAELYQKDLHFVMELVQNADDNSYPDGVVPEIGFVLVKADLAEVGVQWTLLVTNNEIGFNRKNVESLCSIGRSTKKGRRATGYIGEKGIGFKSVFLITRHPVVISNGFRIRFDEAPTDDTGMGFIVPQWADKPTDDALRACLKASHLPSTIIMLPVRDDKVQAMRDQLHEISPSLVLFLNKIEKIYTREVGAGPAPNKTGMSVQKRHHSAFHGSGRELVVKGAHNNYSVMHLSHKTEAVYHLWRQHFPVKENHVVPERSDVKDWLITLAFLHPDSGMNLASIENLFAFLPTKVRTGLPFIINADFLLVSSRESLRTDSVWNQGILSCIPEAFMGAFRFLLQSLENDPASLRLIYELIPRENVVATEFEFIRKAIHQRLTVEDIILCDSDLGQTFPCTTTSACFLCGPSQARFLHPQFREFLKHCKRDGVPSPAPLVHSRAFYIVDEEVQTEHSRLLRALGVQDFTEQNYLNCLKSSEWLLKLPDALYIELLSFLSIGTIGNSSLRDLPFLRYVKHDSTMGLLSPSEINSLRSALYLAQVPKDQHFLSVWTPLFARFASIYFMPARTKENLELLPQPQDVITWLNTTAGITNLSVEEYAKLLLSVSQSKVQPEPAIGIFHFLLKAYTDGYLSREACTRIFSEAPLVEDQGSTVCSATLIINSSKLVFLPASASQWPQLILRNTWASHLLVLSERYIDELPPFMSNITQGEVVSFLKTTGKALDLFDMTWPPNAPLAIMSNTSMLTKNVVHLLLKWLTIVPSGCIPSGLWESITGIPWIKTVYHSYQQPSATFSDRLSGYQLGIHLDQKDVPFVDSEFYGDLMPYKGVLENLGVVCSVQSGNSAVVTHMSNIWTNFDVVDTTSAIRWYKYLRRNNWTSKQKVMIWVPHRGWASKDDCVVRDASSFLSDRLVVLNTSYNDEDVLLFFEHNLHVPGVSPPQKYLERWLEWSATPGSVELDERTCELIWEQIVYGWKLYSTELRGSFKQRCRVPTSSLELATPSEVLYPDSLMLAEMFSAVDKKDRLKLAWHPRSAAAGSWVEQLLACYEELGVKPLSSQVQEVAPTTSWSAPRCWAAPQSRKTKLQKGACRALLAFLADPKHGISMAARAKMVMGIEDLELVYIDRGQLGRAADAGEEAAKLRVELGGKVYEAVRREARVKWDRKQRKMFIAKCSAEEGEGADQSEEASVLMTKHELVTELVKGVLGAERAGLMEGLQELMLVAAAYDFDDGAAKLLLRLRNLRLPVEDESLLDTL